MSSSMNYRSESVIEPEVGGIVGRSPLRRFLAAVSALGTLLLVSAVTANTASAEMAESATHGIEGWGYELVSPVSTAGQIASVVSVNPTGTRVLYRSGGGFADVPNLMNLGTVYRATRKDTGWQTEALGGPPATEIRNFHQPDWMPDWWQDDQPLSMWAAHPVNATEGSLMQAMVGRKGGLWKPISPLVDLDVYAVDSNFQRVLLSGGDRPSLTDGSTDGRLRSRSSLYLAQPAADGSFDIRQVARDGNAAQFTTCHISPGGSAGGITRGAIRREDLTRIIYTTGGCNQAARQRVWVSEPYGPTPQPYDISAPQCTDCGAQQRVEFVGASLDTERVFMTTTQRLVDADTDTSSDLYEYDFRRSTNRLRLISESDTGADVIAVTHVSDTASHVYFVARGPLSNVEIDGERPGPVEGARNLYVRISGVSGQSAITRFVATLSEDDSLTTPYPSAHDGRVIVLLSGAPVTPDKLAGDNHPDAYRYDAQTGELRRLWVSDPDHNGASRTSGVSAVGPTRGGQYANNASGRFERSISENGDRVLLYSAEALVPGDDNDAGDFFVWDAEDGSIAMVSDGKDDQGVYSGALSPDGQTVFISTSSPLAPQHTATSVGLFAYRLGGGFPVEDESDERCSGDDCQEPTSAPPVLPPVGSISFSGDGNVPFEPDPVKTSLGVNRLKAITGSVARLKVRVPDAGRVLITGKAVRRTGRSASRAGTYPVRIALNPRARKLLRKRKRLRVSARVSYRATDGQSASKTIKVTFKQPKAKRAKGKKGGR